MLFLFAIPLMNFGAYVWDFKLLSCREVTFATLHGFI